jgi:hypothetical protein
MEEWKQIDDYPNYSVSNLGNVKNNKTNKLLSLSENGYGYIKVILYKNNTKKTFNLHRLIGKTFMTHFDDNLEIDHIDRNKTNNCLENLRLVTRSENCKNTSKKLGTYSKHKHITYDKSKLNKNWKLAFRIDGIKKHLGYFETEEEAYNYYLSLF